jgi:hypothetical protein
MNDGFRDQGSRCNHGCGVRGGAPVQRPRGRRRRRATTCVGADGFHAGPANVLIFGDLITHMNLLRVRLQQLGHTVTIRPGFGLPSTVEELAQFQTVWHVGRNVPLTPDQQALLAEYLSIGGAVHLTGEGEGAEASNEALTTFVRLVVKRGNGIRIGNPSTVPGPDDGPSIPSTKTPPATWPVRRTS